MATESTQSEHTHCCSTRPRGVLLDWGSKQRFRSEYISFGFVFFYATEHRKTSQIFFASDGSILWYSFVTYAELMRLKLLCLHKLFSSHAAVKSDKTLTTHLSDKERRQILWTKPFSYSQFNTCAHQWNQNVVLKSPPTSALTDMLSFFCLQCSQWLQKERICRINTFFTESNESIE